MSLKYIALDSLHRELGAKMIPFAGYDMPVRYSSDLEEHLAVRNNVGVFDVSHMGEFLVSGPGALPLIQYVTSNDASTLTIGRAQYSCFPNETGGIVDDLIVYKLGEEEYMLVVNASNIEKDWKWVNKHNSFGADLRNISDETSLFAVQGPNSTEILQSICDEDLSAVKFYHFIKGKIGGIDNVIISATGYTGAGGFELYVHNDMAEQLWKKIFEAGSEKGILPIGLGARDTLRLEMGYCLYGNDITDTTSPIEAGLGWITKFSKNFINKDYIEQQKAAGVNRKLTGFVLNGKGIARNGYPILDMSDNPIGEVTSGTISPVLKVGVGLGYIAADFAKPGTEIQIAVRNKKFAAEVQRPPFLKP
jgi:aminomethyltransferase